MHFNMPYITFLFPDQAFRGPVMTRSGKLVYTLFTENTTFSSPPTRVVAADGRVVADMAWGGLTHGQTIIFNGYQFPSLLEKRKDAWYVPSLVSDGVADRPIGTRSRIISSEIRLATNSCGGTQP